MIDDDVMIIEKLSFCLIELSEVVDKEKFGNDSKGILFVDENYEEEVMDIEKKWEEFGIDYVFD